MEIQSQDTLIEKMVGDITFPLAVPSMENHYNTLFSDPDFETWDKEFSHLEPPIDLSIEHKNRVVSEGVFLF